MSEWTSKPWQNLIKPKRLEVDRESLSSTYGKFFCEPLTRGYGVTLGNSLRRILLSSLVGSAVSGVRIEGVLHEFSTIPEVTEDATEIIQNLKEVRVKLHGGDDEVRVKIEKSGPCEVKAGDIVSDKLTIINPDHRLCTVGKSGRVSMEVLITTGRGYVPADRKHLPEGDILTVPVDALYSPIVKVNYIVTHSRVGQVTDYDKLILEVFTNGTVRPDDAVALSAKILKEQLSIFINFEEESDDPRPLDSPRDLEFNKNLLRSVDELELSVRSANCLQNANIRYIYELVQKSENEMLKTKNFGRKSLTEIKEILTAMGLHLGMKLDNFPPPGLSLPSADPAHA